MGGEGGGGGGEEGRGGGREGGKTKTKEVACLKFLLRFLGVDNNTLQEEGGREGRRVQDGLLMRGMKMKGRKEGGEGGREGGRA